MGFLQPPQVLGDRRAADGQLARELAYRTRAIGEALEDRPPGRIAERGKGLTSVSRHER
jgi:hypothetical protein